ncbi:MAG: hypothetical protein WCK49_04565 [Myxococcaceae bacterium]
MKKMTQKLMIALALSVASMPAMAVITSSPTKFVPTLMSEEAPLRFFVNLDSSMAFSTVTNGVDYGAGDTTTPSKFGFSNAQLNLGLIYNVGMGLDVGFGVHGGMQSPYNMFVTPNPAVSDPLKQYGMMFGADIMVRYLAMLSDMFYAGIQAQVGYNYTDTKPGAADSAFTAYSSKSAFNSFIPVVVGVVVGADFAGAASVYLFPALEMGQTSNLTNTTAATTADTGLWKSALGLQLGVGTAIHTSVGSFVIQATPRMANFSNANSWGMDTTLGMYWNF